MLPSLQTTSEIDYQIVLGWLETHLFSGVQYWGERDIVENQYPPETTQGWTFFCIPVILSTLYYWSTLPKGVTQ